MKKIIFIFTLLLLVCTSCKSKTDDFNNELLYKEISSTIEEINVKDYIDYDDKYQLLDKNNQVVDSKIKLEFGENNFTLKKGNVTKPLTFYRLHRYSITLLDNDKNEYQKLDVEEKQLINESDLTAGPTTDGYDFVGFNVNFPFEVKEDTIIEAKYNPKEYDITIQYYGLYGNNNNEKLVSLEKEEIIKVKQGEKLTLSSLNETGYTFDHYRYLDKTIVEDDTNYDVSMGQVIQAIFIPNKYQITFVYPDKTIKKEVRYGEEVKTETPSKQGYKFNNWKYNGEIVSVPFVYKYLENVTYIAEMSPIIYKVEFTNIDNSYSQNVEYGTSIDLPKPTKEGYNFKGWMINGVLHTEDKLVVKSNLTLLAEWEIIESISLNYELYGGEIDIKPSTVNSKIKLGTAKKDGYSFEGWYLDPYFVTKVTEIDSSTYNNEILYAHFEFIDDNFISTFGYTLYNSQTNRYDEVSLYKGGIGISASLYWQKIGIIKIDDEYYVSSIAGSGEKISSMGDYDFVLLAYTDFVRYSDFCSLDITVGDRVVFITDPYEHSDGKVNGMVSFVKVSIIDKVDDLIGYLDNLYGSLVEVDSDINLVNTYENYVIKWESSNNSVISSLGIYHQPMVDCNVKLTAYVSGQEVYSFTVKAKGQSESRQFLSAGYVYTNYGNLTQFAMNNMDIIYCSFLEVNGNAEWTNLNSMVNKINTYVRPLAAASGTKICVSINRSNSDTSAFSTISASDVLRKKFAENIVNVVKDYQLAGIDIDWETPSSSETQNFTLMMKEIYTALKAVNKDYLVTAAIGGGKWAPPKYDLTHSIDYLDYINMMTYSMVSSNSYYQNSLYKSTKGATLVSCSIDESIDIYNDLNIPNAKVLVGIPFYVVLQTGSEGPGSKKGTGKSISYSSYLNNYKSLSTMVEYFDEECGVPYAYDATNGYFASFENERSIQKKSEYIHVKGLAGIMFWQYGQDVNDYFMTAISKHLNS